MEDIITATAVKESPVPTSKEDDFNKEEWAAQKQAERTALFDKTNAVSEAVAKDPETLKGVLSVMSRFPNYSVSNTLLIFDQNPEATRVGDYDFWKSKGAQVKRDEKGIAILEPGSTYERDDGSFGTSYNVKRVFDIAQTTARARQPKEPDMRSLLKALVFEAPIEIAKSADLPEGVNAIFDPITQTIGIREGLGEKELFRTLVQKMTEVAFDSHAKDNSADDKPLGNSLMVVFVVSERYGLDTSDLRPSLVNFTEKSTPADIRAELSSVKGAVKEISDRMDAGIREAQKAARESSMER